jgi:hypothetical protein
MKDRHTNLEVLYQPLLLSILLEVQKKDTNNYKTKETKSPLFAVHTTSTK